MSWSYFWVSGVNRRVNRAWQESSVSAYVFGQPLSSSSPLFFSFHSSGSAGFFSFSPGAAAERWQVEIEPVGQAILSPLDTVMIVDTDWTASHCHPGISVWTVMSKTYEMPASYYLFPLSVCSFTVSKNTTCQCCTEKFAKLYSKVLVAEALICFIQSP